MVFTQKSGAITGMSFRTDGVPTLATGCSSGVVHIWDLERRRLGATLAHAHDDAVRTVHFLTNEPVLVTSGADNSIKMWIFDLADGTARLLRSRSGHSAPPTKIRYYGNGQQLLSCGTDRSFRRFSTIQEHQSRELSQGSLAQKAKKFKVRRCPPGAAALRTPRHDAPAPRGVAALTHAVRCSRLLKRS